MAPVSTQRWIRVGHSADPDARTAGRAATAAALTAGDDTRLLVVFASSAYDLDVLVATIHETAGDIPMIGCSTAGEIATSGAGDATVVVTAIGGDIEVATGCAQAPGGQDLRTAGAEAAACIGDVERRAHSVLMILSDGLAGDQAEVVRGAYNVVGPAVPLVGGCAGDDLKMERTFQFHDGRVLTDAVVTAALTSDSPFGIGVRHGWRQLGKPVVVTASEANHVLALDDRPALDVYLELTGAPEDARTSPEAFSAFALTHPLALAARRGEEQMRFIGGADFEARSLICVAEVPVGGLVWVSEGDDSSVLEATAAACDDALIALDGAPPAGLFAFDCIARRGVLGDDGIAREIECIAARGGGVPVAGFYTYGEIARTRGVTGFHNQTLVVLAVS